MKRIELQVSGDLNYKANIIGILRTPRDPQSGAGYEEMSHTVNTIVAVESADGFVDLSDTEHSEIVDRFKNARFVSNSPEIYRMIDDIENAENPTYDAD